jgi:multidrug efflux pump subunit AcrA (membrane-fusion protein)
MIRRRIITFVAVVGTVAMAAWGSVHLLRTLEQPKDDVIPVAPVRKTSVVFTIAAKGDLQGGNSKMMTAPMTGSAQLILTELRKPGDLVKEGDLVAQFDTTEENFKLREAESDLAEAEQQVIQAENETLANEEELNAELIKARADLEIAKIECQRNPLVAAITAKQNDLALAAARERLEKLERDYPQRKAAASASRAIQEAGRNKALVQAETAKRNIENMSLRAPVAGYVNIERNTSSNWFFPGMTFPLYQAGDSVRPGMAVAQIPDFASWEVTARLAEQDRGHLSIGQPAAVRIVALPGRTYRAKLTNLGGTTGPPWNRRSECKLALEESSPELRPGLSVEIVVETGRLEGVLAIPAQALFERDAKPYVYAKTSQGFTPQDVKLVRRSESQVVIEGIPEGQLVALASPDQQKRDQPNGKNGSATKAIAR